ncbi:hypothetical protein AB0F42_01785 [Streptomyces buecherae]|uniref:hypothetical protein n=1 Tax=Streptomyces buecherae TaxID=2763006 RepID=UPI0033E49460
MTGAFTVLVTGATGTRAGPPPRPAGPWPHGPRAGPRPGQARRAGPAFTDPDRYLGRRLETGADELTFTRVARVYERVTGTSTRLAPLPVEERMFAWFAEEGYRADIPSPRALQPELLTFEEFPRARLAPARD